jgi:hypothetical protein
MTNVKVCDACGELDTHPNTVVGDWCQRLDCIGSIRNAGEQLEKAMNDPADTVDRLRPREVDTHVD